MHFHREYSPKRNEVGLLRLGQQVWFGFASRKILRDPSGRGSYNTFCKKIVGPGKIYNATLRFFKNLQRTAAT